MLNIRFWSTTIFLLCISTLFYAQTEEELNRRAQNWFNEGSSLLSVGDFQAALPHLQRVLSRYPDHFLSNYYSGISHFELGNYEESLIHFKFLTQLSDLNPMYNDSWLLLGQTLMQLGRFDEAVEPMKIFYELESEGRWAEVARGWMENAKFARDAASNPVEFEPQLLNIPLDDYQSAYLPMKSLDGKSLFFTVREENRESLVWSEKLDDGWTDPQPILFLEEFAQVAAPSLSPDGNLMLLTICNHRLNIGGCDLYLASRHPESGEWRGPYNLGEQVNSRGWDSQATFAPDGRTFYFSSDRPGGMGGRDIWYSRLLSGGNFMQPINAGPEINTAENEASPFLHRDGRTLYFKSKGHIGMGDYDLFVARQQKDGSWGEVTNLGYPINTMAHDGAIFVDSDGKTAYMASDRFQPADQRGIYRIFQFELPDYARGEAVTYIRALVTDAKTNEAVQARVQIVNLTSGEIVYNHQLGSAGTLFAVLEANTSFSLNAEMEGYSFVSKRIVTDEKASPADPFIVEIRMDRIEAGDTIQAPPVVLENVLFGFGSHRLDSTSFPELDRLIAYLSFEKNVWVEIHGHTDNVGTDEINMELSLKRAQSVVKYLTEGGVGSHRVKAMGFGSGRPVADNDTEEGRALNRRIEMHVFSDSPARKDD